MTEYLSLFLVSLSAVFFVVDPIGVVPLFLAMTANDAREKVRRTAARACLVAGGLMLFFALFGGVVFKVFGVSLGAFRVAGGILLLITALDMLRARTSETRTTPGETLAGAGKEDIAIVPLAMPVLLAVVLTFLAAYVILRAAGLVQRVLGQSGVLILERVMGLILAAIAVQFMA